MPSVSSTGNPGAVSLRLACSHYLGLGRRSQQEEMHMQTLKQLTLSAVLSAAALLIGAITAVADPVTFIANTSGTFGAAGCAACTASGSILSNGGTTITFSSASPAINVTLVPVGEPGLNFSYVYLGQFT